MDLHPIQFVGAGPGAADLITVRGARLLAEADCVVYAGSLVPEAVLIHCRPGAEKVDSAPLHLEAIVGLLAARAREGKRVVRLHTGDPSLYGAVAEQQRRLDALRLAWEQVPGVSSFQAAAAALKVELTQPGLSQTVILTRAEGRSTPLPPGEELGALAASGATLCLFLSAGLVASAQESLLPHYGPDCPVGVVEKASWPEQRVLRCALKDLAATLRAAGVASTAMIIVGRVLGPGGGESRLYGAGFGHGFRSAG